MGGMEVGVENVKGSKKWGWGTNMEMVVGA